MNSILAVLDTNVCLDLFVFRDPAIKPFHDAIKADTFHAITREDCREEWLRVLDYPKLNLDVRQKERSKLEFDELIQLIEPKNRITIYSPSAAIKTIRNSWSWLLTPELTSLLQKTRLY